MHLLSKPCISCVQSSLPAGSGLLSFHTRLPTYNNRATGSRAGSEPTPFVGAGFVLKQSLEGLVADLSACTVVVPRPPGAGN